MNDEARRARREQRIRRIVAVGAPVLRLLARSWRFEQENAASWHALRREGKPIIFAFWHARMLPLVQHHRDQGVAVLVSEHVFPAHRPEFVVDLPHAERSIAPSGLRLVD